MEKDLEHLRLLAIFHYVVAGFSALFSLVPIIHLALGIALVSGSLSNSKDEPLSTAMGWFFIIFATVWIVSGLALSVCLVVSGKFLVAHKHYLYCLVLAGLACAFMPFGTVLGVFTIVVLQRDSVKLLFGRSVSPPVEHV